MDWKRRGRILACTYSKWNELPHVIFLRGDWVEYLRGGGGCKQALFGAIFLKYCEALCQEFRSSIIHIYKTVEDITNIPTDLSSVECFYIKQ